MQEVCVGATTSLKLLESAVAGTSTPLDVCCIGFCIALIH
jgi:hypothetical protein